MSDLVFKEEGYAIVGACFEVYKYKGCGFLEAVHQECLQIEFTFQKIHFVFEPILEISYRG